MDKTGIANLALSNLGESSIQSLTDNNARARACNGRIDDVITTVLRMHVWNSALERKELTSLYLLYVAVPTDINNLDSLLSEAIAMKLALEIAETLTSKAGLKDEMMRKYVIALQEARSANSKDRTPDHRERSSYFNSKRGQYHVIHRTFNTPSLGYEVDMEAWKTKSSAEQT